MKEWRERRRTMSEPSLYERLGGVFAIAAVIDHFSDAVVQNPIVGQGSQNPELRDWHTNQLDRLPGLKFMRTLWVCNVAGGPLSFAATKPGSTPLGLEEAHRDLHIAPEEFDEVAAELGRTLDHFGVPAREKDEVLAAFAAHKGEVTEGSMASAWESPRVHPIVAMSRVTAELLADRGFQRRVGVVEIALYSRPVMSGDEVALLLGD
jgi:hemoglobin